MQKLSSKIIFLCGIILITGCASNVKLSQYKELSFDQKESDIRPPEYIVNRKRPKVAILPFEDTSDFGGNLSKPTNEGLSQLLSASCGLDVLERGQLDKVFEEAKFAASFSDQSDYSKLANYSKDIDFLLVGSITNAAAGASFSEASSWTDKKGRVHYTPASCSVQGKATINVRSVSTSTGSVQKVFKPLNGSSSASTQVRSSSECRVGNAQQLVIAALSNAIEKSKNDFLDAFPNFGYISKTMTNTQDEKKRIAHISLGKNDGLKPGDLIIIGKFEKKIDRIKGTEGLILHELGETKVNATGLEDSESIIEIPEELVDTVVTGYIVKTKTKRGIFGG